MFRIVLAVLGLLSFVLLPQQSRANVILNGDFESPSIFEDFNIPAGSTSISNWTVTEGNVDLTSNSCCFVSFSGNQAVDLVGDNTLGPVGAHGATGIGGLTQTFTTTPGQTYTVTLHYSRNYGGTDGDGTPVTTVSALLTLTDKTSSDGLLSDTITDSDPTPSSCNNPGLCPTWDLYSNTFTAESAQTVFTINNTVGGHNGGIYLDDIDIEPVGVSGTPLPGALPLMAGGLGVFGLVARRKRKAKAA